MRNLNIRNVHRTYIAVATLAVLLAPYEVSAQHRKGVPSRAAAEAPFDQQMLATQVALDRAGFSAGEIDAVGGTKTRQALEAFQKSSSGAPAISGDPLMAYTITEQDAAGPFVEVMPTDMMDKAKLPALGYTSVLEALAEKFHSSPNFLKRLNPEASWKAGDSIKVPNVEPFELPAKTAAAPAAGSDRADRAGRAGRGGAPAAAAAGLEVTVSGTAKTLQVRDASGKILLHAPVTTGSEHDPLPIGQWKVNGVSWNPVFNYNPDLFWDADATQAKAKIPAGPNNPVGVVWIDISKEHYGLHGTPEPATVGRTESHGCIRLTNWDAARLARLVSPGTKVIFQ